MNTNAQNTNNQEKASLDSHKTHEEEMCITSTQNLQRTVESFDVDSHKIFDEELRIASTQNLQKAVESFDVMNEGIGNLKDVIKRFEIASEYLPYIDDIRRPEEWKESAQHFKKTNQSYRECTKETNKKTSEETNKKTSECTAFSVCSGFGFGFVFGFGFGLIILFALSNDWCSSPFNQTDPLRAQYTNNNSPLPSADAIPSKPSWTGFPQWPTNWSFYAKSNTETETNPTETDTTEIHTLETSDYPNWFPATDISVMSMTIGDHNVSDIMDSAKMLWSDVSVSGDRLFTEMITNVYIAVKDMKKSDEDAHDAFLMKKPNVSVNVSANVFNNVSANVSNNVSANVSNNVSANVSANVPVSKKIEKHSFSLW